MPATRQFVACKFRISDTRTFTYINDADPVAEGDTVRVPDRSGDGWKKVFVVTVTDVDPKLPYDLKAILGKHVDPEDELTPLAAAADKPADNHPNSIASIFG